MLEKPDLPDSDIIELLGSNYNLNVDAIEFLPIGNDQRAWSYRVKVDGGSRFLKLRKGGTRQAAVVVPYELQRSGISEVVAPVAANSGDLYVQSGDFDFILYPFIAGKSAWRIALSQSRARQWGKIVRRIHSVALTPRLAEVIPRESFGVKWLTTIDRVEAIIARTDYDGEIAAATAQLWREQAAEMQLCRRRYQELGARLAAQPPPHVICHADIHTANIIIDADDQIRIVDWDECVNAPKERDLMFFILDGHSAAFESAFFEGYADTDIDWLALAYYKYDWVMQEFSDYGERVFLAAGLGEKDMRAALREFERLFTNDDVIDRAHQAYSILRTTGAACNIGIGQASA